MPGHECFHCKQWIEEGEAHDCWTTTEAALTRDLSEDLQDAWVRLRETAAEFGDQRIYASHHSIMFSRTSCYFFVRPKRSFLEICVFLGREVKAPQLRRVVRTSKVKIAHLLQIRHRDEVETPITDWLREAYDSCDALTAQARRKGAAAKPSSRAVKSPRAARSSRAAKKRAKKRAPERTPASGLATRRSSLGTRKSSPAKKAARGSSPAKKATRGAVVKAAAARKAVAATKAKRR